MHDLWWTVNSIWNSFLKLATIHHEKTNVLLMQNKDADQLCGNHEADHAFVFVPWIVQSLYFLNQKFPASSHLQWLYSLVFVRPCQNPNCWFSHTGYVYMSGRHHSNLRKDFQMLLAVYSKSCIVFRLPTACTGAHYSNNQSDEKGIIACDYQMSRVTRKPVFRPSLKLTRLYSHRKWLEAWNSWFRK